MNSNWVYIKFPNYDKELNWVDSSKKLNEYRMFLTECAGNELDEWEWHRGDRFAQGVYLKNKELATMFRLRFEL